jgi:hypothetical protein
VNDEKIDPLISLKDLLNVGWLNVDEKSIIGTVFDDTGQVWAHKSCAQWSENVLRDDKNPNMLINVDKAVLKGLKQVTHISHSKFSYTNCDERFSLCLNRNAHYVITTAQRYLVQYKIVIKDFIIHVLLVLVVI